MRPERVFFAFAVWTLAGLTAFPTPGRATFFGEIKPGLQFLQDGEKTSFFLYVPRSYTQEKKWPLVVGLAEFGTSTKKYMEHWADEAERRGYIVLCPNWYKSREVPDAGDRWLLRLVNKVQEFYNIDRRKVLLAGYQDGGDYATYLALRYPKRFAAVASLGGFLTPAHENLIYFRRARRHPVPFLVAVDASGEAGGREEIRKKIEGWRKSRMDVLYEEVSGLSEGFRPDLSSVILDWFELKSGEAGPKP